MIFRVIGANKNKTINNNSKKANKTVRILFESKKSKNQKFENLIYISNIKIIEKFIFIIFNTKKTFNYL